MAKNCWELRMVNYIRPSMRYVEQMFEEPRVYNIMFVKKSGLAIGLEQ